jgi:hypothetical protein
MVIKAGTGNPWRESKGIGKLVHDCLDTRAINGSAHRISYLLRLPYSLSFLALSKFERFPCVLWG